MKGFQRLVVDLRSQDLDISDLEKFKKVVMDSWGKKGPEELIMFSSSSKPYQFGSLSDFKESIGSIPDDASYFYFTLTYPTGERCSLYLDPDRPGKIVIEGKKERSEQLDKDINEVFPKGGERYRLHQRFGVWLIWGIIIVMAGIILLVTSLAYGLDPVIFSVIIFTSSILGIYLSMAKSKELQPANTISFVKKRSVWVTTLMHLVTVALGIVSAVLATIIVKGLF